MPTQQYGTGPCFIYTGDNSNRPVYIGTTVSTPRISNRPQWKQVNSDSHGQVVPSDVSYQSQDAMISLQFSRFDHAVINRIRTYCPINGNITPGSSDEGAVGALMVTEGLTRNLWLRFPFSDKAAYANMEPGRRYIHSYLIGPDDLDEIGTNPAIISVTFHAIPIWKPTKKGGTHTLYDANMNGLPAPE